MFSYHIRKYGLFTSCILLSLATNSPFAHSCLLYYHLHLLPPFIALFIWPCINTLYFNFFKSLIQVDLGGIQFSKRNPFECGEICYPGKEGLFFLGVKCRTHSTEETACIGLDEGWVKLKQKRSSNGWQVIEGDSPPLKKESQ